jgi:hypothetical protein
MGLPLIPPTDLSPAISRKISWNNCRGIATSRNSDRSHHLRQRETPMLMRSQATDRRTASICQENGQISPSAVVRCARGNGSRPRRQPVLPKRG